MLKIPLESRPLEQTFLLLITFLSLPSYKTFYLYNSFEPPQPARWDPAIHKSCNKANYIFKTSQKCILKIYRLSSNIKEEYLIKMLARFCPQLKGQMSDIKKSNSTTFLFHFFFFPQWTTGIVFCLARFLLSCV